MMREGLTARELRILDMIHSSPMVKLSGELLSLEEKGLIEVDYRFEGISIVTTDKGEEVLGRINNH